MPNKGQKSKRIAKAIDPLAVYRVEPDVVELLQLSRATIWRRIWAGKLKRCVEGNRTRILGRQLIEYLDSIEEQAA
jgi:hypothetical protein